VQPGKYRDIDEFADYVAKIRPRLQRTAYLMCGDWYLADDLAQESLIKVFRRWKSLDRSGELGPYTMRVLVHQVRREAKRAWRSREVSGPPPDLPAVGRGGDDNRAAIAKALARLGPRQRAIVVLRYWEDLSVEQTARIVGCSQGTVTSQAHRALATLRALLGPIMHSRE
jgi:RNA polymerase sigma-70 factor (sigma-E family)